MLQASVHDIFEGILDLHGKLIAPLLLGGLAIPAQRKNKVHAAKVDILDGGDEKRRPSAERLEEAAVGVRIEQFLHGDSALDHVELHLAAVPFIIIVSHFAGAHQLQHRRARDTRQDDALAERGGDELGAPGVAILHQHEEVRAAGLGHEAVVAEQPQDLVVAAGAGLALRDQRGSVVGADFGVAEPAGPGTDRVVLGREEAHAFHFRCRGNSSGGGITVAVGQRSAEGWGGHRGRFAAGVVEAGEEDHDDVQQGLLGTLDAEGRCRGDHRGADVYERSSLLDPLGCLDADVLFQQLDEFLGREARQGDARGRVQEASGVAIGSEQTHAPIVAAIGLHALEAFGGVVQYGRRGHDGERTVRSDLRGFPAVFFRPFGGQHVVGGVALAPDFGGIGERDGLGGQVGSDGQFGGVEVCNCWAIGHGLLKDRGSSGLG